MDKTNSWLYCSKWIIIVTMSQLPLADTIFVGSENIPIEMLSCRVKLLCNEAKHFVHIKSISCIDCSEALESIFEPRKRFIHKMQWSGFLRRSSFIHTRTVSIYQWKLRDNMGLAKNAKQAKKCKKWMNITEKSGGASVCFAFSLYVHVGNMLSNIIE